MSVVLCRQPIGNHHLIVLILQVLVEQLPDLFDRYVIKLLVCQLYCIFQPHWKVLAMNDKELQVLKREKGQWNKKHSSA